MQPTGIAGEDKNRGDHLSCVRGEEHLPSAQQVIGEVQVGGKPTGDDLFYIDFGGELVKRALPFVNEVLRQMVTLSSALAGGSAAFLGETMIGPGYKSAAVFCFVAALAFAFAGVLPYRDEI